MSIDLLQLSWRPWNSVTFSGARVRYAVNGVTTVASLPLDDIEFNAPGFLLADLSADGLGMIDALIVKEDRAPWDPEQEEATQDGILLAIERGINSRLMAQS